jgi:hypothetical protein
VWKGWSTSNYPAPVSKIAAGVGPHVCDLIQQGLQTTLVADAVRSKKEANSLIARNIYVRGRYSLPIWLMLFFIGVTTYEQAFALFALIGKALWLDAT